MKMKQWYQSRTLWYAILSGLAGVLAVLMTSYPEIGWLAITNAAIVAVLRAITTNPVK